jgi:4,5-DOPA dioxygenase extradiol
MNLNDLFDNKRTTRMPAMFIGHGSPMNAIEDNAYTRRLGELGRSLKEQPRAILVVSAHWLTRGTHVLVSEKPATIHDFGGFPQALFDVEYPAPGAPAIAKETAQLITSTHVTEDNTWGLDHGTWSVLRHMYPEATIPVYQLSIDYYKPAAWHFKLAEELQALRDRGVLIIGSGNIVHNLRAVDWNPDPKPFDWALEFDNVVKDRITRKEYDDLLNYEKLGMAAKMAIPTPDHYYPLIYALGAGGRKEDIQFTYEEIQMGSIDMLCLQIGE